MMDLGLSKGQIAVALGAAKGVAMADGSLASHEAELLAISARTLGYEGDVSELATPTPEELAAALALDGPQGKLLRERAVQGLLLVAMMDGAVTEPELATIKRYAQQLGVQEPALKDLQRIMRGHTTVVKWDLLRRSGMVQTAARTAWEKKGFRGLFAFGTSFYGLDRDAEMAWRYKRLGLLPERSFGRAYWAHMTERGFAFPGEVKGFPEELAKHDLAHVLAGYDTDAPGECEIVAFISGFMKTDPFGYLFMIFLHMQLGVHIFEGTPVEHMVLPISRVAKAFERGRNVNQDLYDPSWDFWADFPLSLDTVREKYGISPA